MAVIPRDTKSRETCYDDGSPFPVKHYGKLGGRKAPRRHCLTQDTSSTALSIVRFTPMAYSGTVAYQEERRPHRDITLAKYMGSAEQAAEIHARHLSYLGKVGLTPWVSEIAPGVCRSLNDWPGLFVRQEVLPLSARSIDSGTRDVTKVYERYQKYEDWAWAHGEVRLCDIGRPSQYSVISGEIVLHDVEPVYDML